MRPSVRRPTCSPSRQRPAFELSSAPSCLVFCGLCWHWQPRDSRSARRSPNTSKALPDCATKSVAQSKPPESPFFSLLRSAIQPPDNSAADIAHYIRNSRLYLSNPTGTGHYRIHEMLFRSESAPTITSSPTSLPISAFPAGEPGVTITTGAPFSLG